MIQRDGKYHLNNINVIYKKIVLVFSKNKFYFSTANTGLVSLVLLHF